MTILTFRHIQCLHLMYDEVAWELVYLGTQVQPQIILNPDYLPDYLSVTYDYVATYFQEEPSSVLVMFVQVNHFTSRLYVEVKVYQGKPKLVIVIFIINLFV